MKTKKKCMWCKYYLTEYRPDVVHYPYTMKEPLKTTALFLGCVKGPVEKHKEPNDVCDDFKWNYEETK